MMELPESHALASQMNEAVRGKRVRDVRVGTSPHKFFFTEEGGRRYAERLRGRALGETRPLGIYLETAADGMALLVGEGLALRYTPPGAKPLAKHQLHIELEDGSALWGSVSMYGGAWVYPAGSFQNPYYLTATEKPSPLTSAFDEAYFEGILAATKPSLSVKALLATEQRIPGLGNGVLQDILLSARIHPRAKLSSLDDERLRALYHSVKDTLCQMATEGGRDTERGLHGAPGGYHTLLCAKTWQQPCPVCGGVIQKASYLGGSIYACPNCQLL